MFNENFPSKRKSKKAQVGETISWIFATVIILLILIVAVFISSFVVKGGKNLGTTNQADLFAAESLASFLLTKGSSGATIYQEISQNGFNDFSGNLAVNIFSLFSNYYDYGIFMGILDRSSDANCAQYNPYFASSNNPSIKAGDQVRCYSGPIIYLINLNNNKLLKLVLWHSYS